MDGGLPAAVLVSPLLHLRMDVFLSNRWGPPHNDRPEVRETFKTFKIEREEISYTAQAKPGKRYGELLITN